MYLCECECMRVFVRVCVCVYVCLCGRVMKTKHLKKVALLRVFKAITVSVAMRHA